MKIDLSPLGFSECFDLDESAIASFVTGSSVNGYFRNDSDIDVVAVYRDRKESIEKLNGRLSLHTLNASFLEYYERAMFYSALRNIPLHNSNYVAELSFRTKREMIMRESKRLQKIHKKQGNKNQALFTPWKIISRYFTRQWGIVEPARLKPLNRILASQESRKILEEEYTPIFDNLEESGFLNRSEDRYSICERAVLNEDRHKIFGNLSNFLWLYKESHGGLSYLAHAPEIIKNVREIYRPKK